ncbi:MAG: hypothetical protein LBS51_03785 [Oscillospiraceae bacterium]|jgi:hypothetical protein|nr:hypothetical protein [Oscillospiraceae bacterium]
MNARATEAVKSAVIVLLAVSALALGSYVEIFGDAGESVPFFSVFSGLLRSGLTDDGAGETVSETAVVGERPMCIVITNAYGERYGVKYDTAQLELLYGRTSSVLGEAFGSASDFAETDETEWRDALGQPCIYYTYPAPVGVELLGGWFGAAVSAGGSTDGLNTRRLCVVFGGERVRLLFQESGTGAFYGADTDSLGEESQMVGLYGGNGVRFAFETDGEYAGDPYAVLMPDTAHPVVEISNPTTDGEKLGEVLSGLGVGNQLKSSYTEPDGTMVFVTNTFKLSIDTGGDAIYRRTAAIVRADDASAPALTSVNAAVSAARAAAVNTVGKICGDAGIVLTGVSQAEPGVYTASFEYGVAGGEVHLSGGRSAARVTVSGGEITSMLLTFRRFTVTDETSALLPERQALAAAGQEITLGYSDTGGSEMVPEWAELLIIRSKSLILTAKPLGTFLAHMRMFLAACGGNRNICALLIRHDISCELLIENGEIRAI